ncbi:probable serine/threonine-protein kinase PBL21 isoform X1, partial [Fagus crenata]
MKGIAIFVSEGIFLSDPDVVHHPNLVKLMGCYCEVEYGHFGVFYDLRSKDTLLNLIDKDDLTWTQRVKVALDIARLVEHLHHHKPPYVLHFTHPALIMLDQDYNPVLFDFFNLSGGAVGDKQLSSYSDMFTFSQGYHGYIDVNFLMTALSWEETVKILRGVANGLVYLHIFQEHAIVCGDMKPQNILLGNDYVAKISDFGLAKVEMEQVISNTRAYFPYCNAG